MATASNSPGKEIGITDNQSSTATATAKNRKRKTPSTESTHPQTPPQQLDPPPSSSSTPKRTKSPGVRCVGKKIYDSTNGRTCHQCRQKTVVFAVFCTYVKENNKQCTINFCERCLSNRYGENAVKASASGNWICPKCRGICNCSFCMKKKGCAPTGILARTAKAKGFSSVSSLLNAQGSMVENVEKDDVSKMQDASVQEAKVKSTRKRRKQTDADGGSQDEQNMIDKKREEDLPVQIHLPNGTELPKLADIDIPSGDIGHALQLLEYCETFGEVIGLKKGEAETLLHELASGIPSQRREALIVRFHIKLLSLIEEDSGRRLSKKSWVNALLKLISECQYPAKAGFLDCISIQPDGYEELSFSKKLRILNFLCDEALSTVKLRSWIIKQNSEDMKKAKEKLVSQREKEKILKKKLQDEVAKAILSRDGVPLLVSEYRDLISKVEAETAEKAKTLAHEGAQEGGQQNSNVLRSEPIISDTNGLKLWKLRSCSDKIDVLLQDSGCGDVNDCDEKWLTYNAQDKVLVDQYISNLRNVRR